MALTIELRFRPRGVPSLSQYNKIRTDAIGRKFAAANLHQAKEYEMVIGAVFRDEGTRARARTTSRARRARRPALLRSDGVFVE